MILSCLIWKLNWEKLTNGFLMNVWRFWQISGCHFAKIIMLKFLKFSVLYNRIECIYVAVCSVGALNLVFAILIYKLFEMRLNCDF